MSEKQISGNPSFVAGYRKGYEDAMTPAVERVLGGPDATVAALPPPSVEDAAIRRVLRAAEAFTAEVESPAQFVNLPIASLVAAVRAWRELKASQK